MTTSGDPNPGETRHKIGEIAAMTGMTVRTLRYYEEIGLITPDERTDAGHRLYGSAAVQRLYQISLLRELGLPLTGVQAGLDAGRGDLRTLMTTHLETVDARLAAENRLRNRLVGLVGTLETTTEISAEDTTGALLDVLEDMTMLSTTIDKRIAILVYEDLEAAYDHLTTVFGFGPGELTRDPDGNVVHGEIQAGDGAFWLHPESPDFGLQAPASLGGSTGSMAIMVDDVDAHFAHASEHGATIRYEPMDQPYGYREYGATDPGGHLWSFMKAL